jgi:hypothetical protein
VRSGDERLLLGLHLHLLEVIEEISLGNFPSPGCIGLFRRLAFLPLALLGLLALQLLENLLVSGLVEEVDQIFIVKGRVSGDGDVVSIEIELMPVGGASLLLGLVGSRHGMVGIKIRQFPSFLLPFYFFIALGLRLALFIHAIIQD